MTVPHRPGPIQPGHLLAAHLGSEGAAAAWRRRRDRDELDRLRAAVARGLAAAGTGGAAESAAVERELRLLRDKLAEQRAELRQLRTARESDRAEVAEALDYLTARNGVQRNGSA